jgi:hypothetical protein
VQAGVELLIRLTIGVLLTKRHGDAVSPQGVLTGTALTAASSVSDDLLRHPADHTSQGVALFIILLDPKRTPFGLDFV